MNLVAERCGSVRPAAARPARRHLGSTEHCELVSLPSLSVRITSSLTVPLARTKSFWSAGVCLEAERRAAGEELVAGEGGAPVLLDVLDDGGDALEMIARVAMERVSKIPGEENVLF